MTEREEFRTHCTSRELDFEDWFAKLEEEAKKTIRLIERIMTRRKQTRFQPGESIQRGDRLRGCPMTSTPSKKNVLVPLNVSKQYDYGGD